MQKRRLLSVLVLASAGSLAASLFPHASPPPQRAAVQAAPALRVEGRSPERRFAELPAREALGKPQGELFAAPAPELAPRPAKAVSVAVLPAPPPMPYRIAGQVVANGAAHVVLARDDRVFTARPGDMLDDDYRLESVGSDGVTLVYLPLNTRQHLPVIGAISLDVMSSTPGSTAALAPAGGLTSRR